MLDNVATLETYRKKKEQQQRNSALSSTAVLTTDDDGFDPEEVEIIIEDINELIQHYGTQLNQTIEFHGFDVSDVRFQAFYSVAMNLVLAGLFHLSDLEYKLPQFLIDEVDRIEKLMRENQKR